MYQQHFFAMMMIKHLCDYHFADWYNWNGFRYSSDDDTASSALTSGITTFLFLVFFPLYISYWSLAFYLTHLLVHLIVIFVIVYHVNYIFSSEHPT